ncbi:MAG: hypothetical protein RLN87_14200 [Parasphingopyxis sp.]|uniref:hypothetical protein n=1 Tax=Parasphingopyxis sp. TaxID=1920299 RepID=UPI00260C7F21|nr:hypothetical protein [uncultured Parasphingopyxis sp.]
MAGVDMAVVAARARVKNFTRMVDPFSLNLVLAFVPAPALGLILLRADFALHHLIAETRICTQGHFPQKQ